MKKTVLVINGNVSRKKAIRNIAPDADNNIDLYIADTVANAYELILSITIDVFIIDVILETYRPGDVSGVRLIEQVRGIPKYVFTPVIFVTAKVDPLMYAYIELNYVDYIKRPYKSEELKKALLRALHYQSQRNENKALIFRRGSIIFSIDVKDIVFIECVEHKMHLHLNDGTVRVVFYKTCKTLLYEADVECLFQCGRGMVINREYVQRVDIPKHLIFLKNDMGKVNVGVTYRRKVMEELVKKNHH